jgi:hypothetical protein
MIHGYDAYNEGDPVIEAGASKARRSLADKDAAAWLPPIVIESTARNRTSIIAQ